MVFHLIIRCYCNGQVQLIEDNGITDLQANHMELESRFLCSTFLFLAVCFYLFVLFLALADDRFPIHINSKFTIIKQVSNITHDIQGYRRSNIEKLSVLTNAKVGQTVYLLMNLLLNLVELRSL